MGRFLRSLFATVEVEKVENPAARGFFTEITLDSTLLTNSSSTEWQRIHSEIR